MSWDNFNESGELKAQIEASECFHGILSVSQFMPLGSIGQEKTERACQERGIRISEPLLGRPPTHVSKQKKRSKHCQMRGLGMQFVRKFGACANADLVSIT
jgi:hypothetical protein